MQKRVFHKPKGCLLKIEPIDDDIGQVSKAIDLILPDGQILTREMIEQMEISSESDEIGEREETVKTPCTENINMPEAVNVNIHNVSEVKQVVEKEISHETNKVEIEKEVGETVSYSIQEDLPLETYVFAPPSKIVNKVIRYTIDYMLKCPDREELVLNIDKSILKKPESNVQRFRIEMNRIAWVNLENVVRIVRNYKLNQLEMSKCAEILFEKAIFEDNFCILYAAFINRLRSFCYINENINNEGDAFFFSNIIELCWNTVDNRESWSIVEKETNNSNKVLDEYENDSALIDANKIKDRIFGTLRFLVIMIVNNILEPKFINQLVEKVMKNNSDENAELMVSVLTDMVYELYLHDKDLFASVKNYLTGVINITKETRIRFMTMDAIDKMKEIEKGKVIISKYCEEKIGKISQEPDNKQTQDSSRFRRGTKFANENIDKSNAVSEITSKINSLEVKNRFGSNNGTRISKLPHLKPVKTSKELFKIENTFEKVKNLEIKLTESEIEYCQRIVEEFASYKDEDRDESLKEVNKDIRAGKITKPAFTASLVFVGLKSNDYDCFCKFFTFAAKYLTIDPKTMFNGMLYTKDMMEDLVIDFPLVKHRYENFRIEAKNRGLIDGLQFEKLQIDGMSNNDVCKTIKPVRSDENIEK